MNANIRRTFFHWTSLLIQGGIVVAPISVTLWRNKMNFGFYLRKMESADLPKMADKNLLNLVETEMISKSEDRLYPYEKYDFGIKVKDDIESNTYGFFYCQNGVTFRFTTRLALNDVDTIRRNYPNFLKLFKENLKSRFVNDFKSIKDNFRSAKGLRDFLTVFREKDLGHLCIETSTLSDDDLKKVLLTPNAKKFAITRELLLADSFFHAKPTLYSLITFGSAWIFFSYLKMKMPEKFAVAIAFFLALFAFILLDRADRINEFAEFDRKCVELDDVYLSGAKEYLQSSIELGKLLYRLTDGKTPFDADGNCKWHMMKYTDRMKMIEKMETWIAKDKENPDYERSLEIKKKFK